MNIKLLNVLLYYYICVDKEKDKTKSYPGQETSNQWLMLHMWKSENTLQHVFNIHAVSRHA